MTANRQFMVAFTRAPDVENAEVGRLVMWAGLLATILPCALLFIIGVVRGRTLFEMATYGAAILVYIALLLLIYIPSRVSRWIWRHLAVYLLVLGFSAFSIQSLVDESFLQPIVFLVPIVFAATLYSAARVLLVALLYLGLMNLGIWFSGVREAFAFLFPTFGYGTFMIFTFAFTRLSVEQSAARREADRLASDLARERDYLARLAEITASLTRDLDLTTVLAQVAGEGRTLAHADEALVWLRDDDDQTVRLAAAVPTQHSAAAVSVEARWNVAELADLRANVRTDQLVLPLVFKGETIGALELRASPDEPFGSDDARLLQPFADAAAVAIENARLFEQAQQSATLSERNRLARELHDTIAQGLTATTMQLEAAQRSFERDPARARTRLARAHELARDTLQDVRRSVWTLAAPLIDGEALGTALAELAQRFAERTGIAATYEHSGPAPRLGHAAATQVIRIVQEALTNVEKHAHAHSVQIASEQDAEALRVSIRDDGVGFAPDSPAANGARGSGFGLISLRERAHLAGGTLQVESAPGAGTRVETVIPVAEATREVES